jgi:hypothetical protein
MPKTSPAKTAGVAPKTAPFPFRPFPYIRKALECELKRRPGVTRNFVLNEKLAIAFQLPEPNMDEIDGRRSKNSVAP